MPGYETFVPKECELCHQKIYLGQDKEHSEPNTATHVLGRLDEAQRRYLASLGCSYSDGEVLDCIPFVDRFDPSTEDGFCADCRKEFQEDTLVSEIALGNETWKYICSDCLPTDAYDYYLPAITEIIRAVAGQDVPRL